MINRQIYQTLLNTKESKKVVVVLGPRQTGKTTLLKKIAHEIGIHLWLNCDDPNIRESLELKSTEQVRQIIRGNEVVDRNHLVLFAKQALVD